MAHRMPSSENTMSGTQTKWINSLVGLRWLSLYWASREWMLRDGAVWSMGVSGRGYYASGYTKDSTPERRQNYAAAMAEGANAGRAPRRICGWLANTSDTQSTNTIDA